jgi:hypothetical protein
MSRIANSCESWCNMSVGNAPEDIWQNKQSL